MGIPPPAGSLLQVGVDEDPADEEGETVFDNRPAIQPVVAAEPAPEDEATKENSYDDEEGETVSLDAPVTPAPTEPITPSPTQPEEDEEATMIFGLDEGDEVTTMDGAASDLFIVGEDTAPVKKAQEEHPEAGVVAIAEIRTKLKFKGNKIGLRNPQMVPALVKDIHDLMAKHPGSKFVYCVHVGTSAGEKIKTARPGFMEGRVKTLVDALAEEGSLDSANSFEHFSSTRFAGLVMKVYNGEEAPACKQDDLI